MMNSEQVIRDSCVSKYEELIEEASQDAKSVEDLETAHSKVKKEIENNYFKKKDVSEALRNDIWKDIEAKYAPLLEYFELKYTSDKNKQKDVVKSPTVSKAVCNTTQDIAIGIDLGTTMCCVAVFNNGKIEIIPNRDQGNVVTTPSYVCIQDDGEDTFGAFAKQRSYRFPETTIYDAKRMIGRPWNDPDLQNDIRSWPFEVTKDDLGNPKIKIGDKTHYPHEVSARLLSHFRIIAEQHLGLPSGSITKAVITVPAYFTEPQRRATEEAATCAGLKVLNILSEPSAAAIAYNFLKSETEPKTVLIYDLGGGTFDVAIAKVTPNNVDILGVDGDTHLGGQDFDQAILDHCLSEFAEAEGIDLLENRYSQDKTKRDACKRALSRLKLQCERVKEQLSSSETATVEVLSIFQEKDMQITITRQQMESMILPIVQKTIDIVAHAIKAARTNGISSARSIDDVVLIGGSTRIPLAMKMVQDYFDDKEPCQSIDPDQAVAYGAAIQAAIYNKHSGIPAKLEVFDVLPMSIGIEVDAEKLSVVIPKNTRIPCEYSKIYATNNNMQTMLKFKVYQGEHYWSYDNKRLAEFTLHGIAARAEGQEKAKLTMTIDFMGILHVSAVSLSSGKEEAITITSDKLGMDVETIKRLSDKLRPRPPVMA